MFQIKLAIAALLTMAAVSEARADFIVRCGASEGDAYYLEGGKVPVGGGGWTKDKISNGQILLVAKKDKWQLLIGDIAGMRDVESDGGKLVVMAADAHMITVVVAYALAVETYGFRIRKGHSEVVWTSVKSTGIVDKGSVMHADCELVN